MLRAHLYATKFVIHTTAHAHQNKYGLMAPAVVCVAMGKPLQNPKQLQKPGKPQKKLILINRWISHTCFNKSFLS